MSTTQNSVMPPEKPCCSVAKILDAKALERLNKILRTPEHAGFRKLAAEHGVSKSAVERHKHHCLGLARPFDGPPTVEPPRDLPAVERRPKSVPENDAGTAVVPEVSQADAAPARAPEVAIAAQSHEDRVLYVVSQMAAGTWDGPREISVLSAQWGLDRDTVRRMASEAALVCRVDRGTVEERRQASMGYWRRIYDKAINNAVEPAPFDTPSKCLAVATQAQTGWDRASGVYDDSSKVVNIFTDPRFVEAAKRYVNTVQSVLGSAGLLVERVRGQLGEHISIDVVAAVLSAADDAIAEQLDKSTTPQLPG